MMNNGIQWEPVDIVTKCIENNIKVQFSSEKRFYRLRLKEQCGIFDVRSSSFLKTTSAIFLPSLETEYRRARNDLSKLEIFAAKCR